MAKIREIALSVQGTVCVSTIFYDTKIKLFYIELPDYLSDYASMTSSFNGKLGRFGKRGHQKKEQPFSPSESGVESLAKEIIQSYCKEKRSEKRVILYKIEGESDLFDEAHMFDRKENHPLFSYSSNGLLLRFHHLCAREITIQDKISYLHLDSDDKINWQVTDYYAVMEWTEERELFFAQMKAGFQQMLENVKSFVRDNTHLQKVIDQGKFLSIGTGTK